MRQCRIKTEYVLLLFAYIFMFICMPSLHCHFQLIDTTPHCHNCHGHITLPIDTDEQECYFCPVINFNTISLPFLALVGLFLGFLGFRLNFETLFIKNSFIKYFSSRAPPHMF